MISYSFVYTEYTQLLEEKVEEMLADGWKCQGGIAMAIAVDPLDGKRTFRYAQAMIKEDDVQP